MSETVKKLEELLGRDRLASMADLNSETSESTLQNLNEIYCECKTLILRPNNAKLVVSDHRISKFEKEVSFMQSDDKSFKNLTRGCYWLVDDMYKFEQMGFTKEVPRKEVRIQDISGETTNCPDKKTGAEKSQEPEGLESRTPLPEGFRYLACAECNVCPLGWFNPNSKESYLYVW